MRYVTLLAAGLAALLHTNAIANSKANVTTPPAECEEHAPLIDSGYYFELNDPQPFSADEIRQIAHFTSALEGHWHGTGTIVDCLPRQRSSAGYRRDFKFSGQTTQFNNGALELKGEQEIPSEKKLKAEVIALTPAYSRGNSQHWHTLQFTDDHTMIYSEKYRRRTAIGNQLVHVIYKVALKDGVMQVDSKKFINGHFEAKTGTTLVRAGS
jgi:hypothetical protein